MLNSNDNELLRSSRRNPLWLAAFSFKNLKKAHIFETNISSSVDKILQEEINAVSYRVLSYLLLGVVRIYSKKADYLFHDCNEVLFKIKNFVINTKNYAHVETLRMSVTIPDRFELDAFDLGIVEDDRGGHIAPQEEITLKEVVFETEGFGMFSQGKFEDLYVGQNTCSSYHLVVEGCQLSCLMDMDSQCFPPNSSINLLEGRDIFQSSTFSQKEPMNIDTLLIKEGVEESINLSVKEQQINEDQTVQEAVPCEDETHEESRISQFFPPNSPINLQEGEDIFESSTFSQNESMKIDTVLIKGVEKESINLSVQEQQIKDLMVHETVPCEDEIHEERSIISQEESMNINMSSGRQKEPVASFEEFNESHQVNSEHITVKEMPSSLSQMNQETSEAHKTSFHEIIERPRDEKFNGNKCKHLGKSSVNKEFLEEFTEWSVEKHDREGKLEFQENISLEDERLSIILPESTNLDVTPQSKFRGGSVGRSKTGATTPEFMLSSTPALRERSCFLRKRKCVFDETIVVPNEVLKKSIDDASDLVANRGKFCPTLLTLQRKSRISSLPDGFHESLLPCNSSELQLLFSKKKIKIPESLEIESLGKSVVTESQTVGSPEHVAAAPQTPPQCPDPFVIEESARKLDVSETRSCSSPEHIATAPQTPPLCQNIKIRPIEHQQRAEIPNSDNLGPSSPHESIEREKSFKMNVHNLMEEEINSHGTENSELLAGWSERTRKVASYMHQSFQHPRKQREGNVVNLSELLGGLDRKESARLFYEILVLKTTSYVDVKQHKPYGDIAIRKLPKLDQTF